MTHGRANRDRAIRWTTHARLFNVAVAQRRHQGAIGASRSATTPKASHRSRGMEIDVARGIMRWRSGRAERRTQRATMIGVVAVSLACRMVHGEKTEMSTRALIMAAIMAARRPRHPRGGAPTWSTAALTPAGGAAMATTTPTSADQAATGAQSAAHNWSETGSAAALTPVVDVAMPEMPEGCRIPSQPSTIRGECLRSEAAHSTMRGALRRVRNCPRRWGHAGGVMLAAEAAREAGAVRRIKRTSRSAALSGEYSAFYRC